MPLAAVVFLWLPAEMRQAVSEYYLTAIQEDPVTFLQGCRALHETFRRFAIARQDLASRDDRDFDDIAEHVLDVLIEQGDKDKRIEAWRGAAARGSVFGQAGEEIPEYEGHTWNDRWKDLDGAATMDAGLASPVWRFYQAASLHRTYVIRDLLPRHRLIVD